MSFLMLLFIPAEVHSSPPADDFLQEIIGPNVSVDVADLNAFAWDYNTIFGDVDPNVLIYLYAYKEEGMHVDLFEAIIGSSDHTQELFDLFGSINQHTYERISCLNSRKSFKYKDFGSINQLV